MKVLAFSHLEAEFVARWIPLQFTAWKRARSILPTAHADKDLDWAELPDDTKKFVMSLVPLQLEILLGLGAETLTQMKQAAANDDRSSIQGLIVQIAAQYHDAWYLVRQMQISHLDVPPKKRNDDAVWTEISDVCQTEGTEIVWQWCVMFHRELDPADFHTLCESSDSGEFV